MARYEWNSIYILKTDNPNLAVSLDDMKLFLKIPLSTTAEDALITSLIKTATLQLEKYCRIEVLNKTFTMYLDFFPYPKVYGRRVEENFDCNTIQVKRSRLQSITSIKYYSNSVLETLGSGLYSFSKSNQYSRIYLIDPSSDWPAIDTRKQSVEIEFIAGNGDDDTEVPEDLKTYIKQITACLYENRGDCACEAICSMGSLSGAMPGINQHCIIEI